MANINGHEIYFGIIGSVQSGSNSPTRTAVGEPAETTSSENGETPQEEE